MIISVAAFGLAIIFALAAIRKMLSLPNFVVDLARLGVWSALGSLEARFIGFQPRL